MDANASKKLGVLIDRKMYDNMCDQCFSSKCALSLTFLLETLQLFGWILHFYSQTIFEFS